MNVRQMWKAKLEGKPVPGASAGPAIILAKPAFAGQVLGVDPSLRGTGLALIEFIPGRQPVKRRMSDSLAVPKCMHRCQVWSSTWSTTTLTVYSKPGKSWPV